MNRTILLTFISYLFFFGLKAQNTEWQTSLEDGFKLGMEENKNVLVEFGVMQDEVPLFISDEAWSDEVIVNKLSDFIPVSVDLTNQLDLANKYEVIFSPTIMLFTPKGELVFRTYGNYSVFELDDILSSLQNNVRKICQLKTVFSDEDALGNLLLLEEYLKASIKAPEFIESDFTDMASNALENLKSLELDFDPVQEQRLKILENLLEQIQYPNSSSLRKFYKIGKKGLLASNHLSLIHI